MKKKDVILLAATFGFSYLFYNQSAGVNYLLFAFLLILSLLWENKNLLYSKIFVGVSTGLILTAFSCFLYSSDISWSLFWVSIFMLGAISFKPATSLIIAYFQGLYNFILSPIWLLFSFKKSSLDNPDTTILKYLKRIILAIIPLIISSIFLGIYAQSNPLFAKFISKINIDFISFEFVFFTLFGFIWLRSFFNQRIIHWLYFYGQKTQDDLPAISLEDHKHSFFGFNLEISNEVFTGVLLFGFLNVLLLLNNFLDFKLCYEAGNFQTGAAYSSFVHEGINALIFSIVLAILLIVYYFRGYINFYSKNKTIKLLAYGWILQNIWLVFSIIYRNWLYIETYGLTYKRIGVFLYLTLAIAGLVTVLWKVVYTKNNVFLLRKNAWIQYAILVLFCLPDWGKIITHFNISNFEKNKKLALDQRYLANLGNSNLPILYKFYVLENKKLNDQPDSNNRILWSSFSSSYFSSEEREMIAILQEKCENLEEKLATQDWQSWCYADQCALRDLKEMKAFK